MKKLIYTLTIGIFLSQFYSCSWVVGFYIVNSGNEDVEVEMDLQKNFNGSFPIFDYQNASLYEISKYNKINYEECTHITYDTVSNYTQIKFKLPAHKAIQIGALQNDKYKNYKQYFINGRVFNLDKILIKKREIQIEKTDFDNYFKSDGNDVIYVIK